MNRQFLLEDFLEARASFQIKITRQVDGSPFLIRELTFKTTDKCHISYGKKKKNAFFPACKNLLSLYLSSGSYIHKWNPFDWYKISMFRALCVALAMGGLTFLEACNISLSKTFFSYKIFINNPLLAHGGVSLENTELFENHKEPSETTFKSYFRPNMTFHNGNFSMLSAENYAYAESEIVMTFASFS